MNRIHILLIFIFISISVYSQDASSLAAESVNISRYLKDVAKGNLGYIAEQFNLGIADAALMAAGVYADPELAFGYSDSQDRQMQLGKGIDAGISYHVNLGNVRAARLDVAGSEKEVTAMLLEQYFRNLRADASLVFYNSLKYKLLAGVQEDTYERMKELARADSIRLVTGTIMEVDARQSAIEARVQKNEAIRADASWRMALVDVTRLMGSSRSDTAYQPSGTLEFPIRDFDLGWLIDRAQENRMDLQAALQNRVLSEKMLRLVRAQRAPELGIETGMSYNTIAINEIAPSPAHYAYNVGLSVPLKFSSLNRGELEAARLAVRQNEVYFRDAGQQIIAEVTQAYIQYQSQKRQLEEFHSGLLLEAETILNNKVYSYRRGETSLLDVLNAQRTYNDIRRTFYETHYEYLASLIDLERAAGIWDVE